MRESAHIAIIGVEEKEVKNGDNGYRIHAIMHALPAVSGKSRVTTPTLYIPDDDSSTARISSESR